MKKTTIVRIDFSKKTIDATYFKLGSFEDYFYKQFANTEQRCLETSQTCSMEKLSYSFPEPLMFIFLREL